MKKLISIVLSLALVACMFGMTVSAKRVVGTRGEAGTIDDGWTDSAWSGSTPYEEAITFNIGTKHSRYAVDVTFTGTLSFNTGSMTWDVNTLDYVHADNNLSDTEYIVTVTNYSDKAVGVALDVVLNDLMNNSGMKFAISEVSDGIGITDTKLSASGTLNGAYDVDATSNKEKTIEMKAQLYVGDAYDSNADKTNDWNDVALYLNNNSNGNTSLVLAKMTVTISKNAAVTLPST